MSPQGHLDLRGCIGCLKPLPITSLRDYAVSSAFRDQRFAPIGEEEMQVLHCTVSLLTNFEQVRDRHDWQIGTHGIIIDFVDPRGVARNGIYLPEVMPEQGWNKQQAIISLIRKAGYSQPVTEQLLASVRLTRYQTSNTTRSYDDWRRARAKSPTL